MLAIKIDQTSFLFSRFLRLGSKFHKQDEIISQEGGYLTVVDCHQLADCPLSILKKGCFTRASNSAHPAIVLIGINATFRHYPREPWRRMIHSFRKLSSRLRAAVAGGPFLSAYL